MKVAPSIVGGGGGGSCTTTTPTTAPAIAISSTTSPVVTLNPSHSSLVSTNSNYNLNRNYHLHNATTSVPNSSTIVSPTKNSPNTTNTTTTATSVTTTTTTTTTTTGISPPRSSGNNRTSASGSGGSGGGKSNTCQACTTCRQKKVRCDGIRPACSACKKSGADCLYVPSRRRGRPARVKRDYAREFAKPLPILPRSPITPNLAPTNNTNPNNIAIKNYATTTTNNHSNNDNSENNNPNTNINGGVAIDPRNSPPGIVVSSANGVGISDSTTVPVVVAAGNQHNLLHHPHQLQQHLHHIDTKNGIVISSSNSNAPSPQIIPIQQNHHRSSLSSINPLDAVATAAAATIAAAAQSSVDRIATTTNNDTRNRNNSINKSSNLHGIQQEVVTTPTKSTIGGAVGFVSSANNSIRQTGTINTNQPLSSSSSTSSSTIFYTNNNGTIPTLDIVSPTTTATATTTTTTTTTAPGRGPNNNHVNIGAAGLSTGSIDYSPRTSSNVHDHHPVALGNHQSSQGTGGILSGTSSSTVSAGNTVYRKQQSLAINNMGSPYLSSGDGLLLNVGMRAGGSLQAKYNNATSSPASMSEDDIIIPRSESASHIDGGGGGYTHNFGPSPPGSGSVSKPRGSISSPQPSPSSPSSGSQLNKSRSYQSSHIGSTSVLMSGGGGHLGASLSSGHNQQHHPYNYHPYRREQEKHRHHHHHNFRPDHDSGRNAFVATGGGGGNAIGGGRNERVRGNKAATAAGPPAANSRKVLIIPPVQPAFKKPQTTFEPGILEYFYYFNGLLPIVHWPSFKEAYEDAIVPNYLIMAMKALSRRYSKQPSVVLSGSAYSAGQDLAAIATSLADIATNDDPNTYLIQTWLILSIYEMGMGRLEHSAERRRKAIDVAHQLGINKLEVRAYQRKARSLIVAENCRRVWWAMHYCDRFFTLIINNSRVNMLVEEGSFQVAFPHPMQESSPSQSAYPFPLPPPQSSSSGEGSATASKKDNAGGSDQQGIAARYVDSDVMVWYQYSIPFSIIVGHLVQQLRYTVRLFGQGQAERPIEHIWADKEWLNMLNDYMKQFMMLDAEISQWRSQRNSNTVLSLAANNGDAGKGNAANNGSPSHTTLSTIRLHCDLELRALTILYQSLALYLYERLKPRLQDLTSCCTHLMWIESMAQSAWPKVIRAAELILSKVEARSKEIACMQEHGYSEPEWELCTPHMPFILSLSAKIHMCAYQLGRRQLDLMTPTLSARSPLLAHKAASNTSNYSEPQQQQLQGGASPAQPQSDRFGLNFRTPLQPAENLSGNVAATSPVPSSDGVPPMNPITTTAMSIVSQQDENKVADNNNEGGGGQEVDAVEATSFSVDNDSTTIQPISKSSSPISLQQQQMPSPTVTQPAAPRSTTASTVTGCELLTRQVNQIRQQTDHIFSLLEHAQQYWCNRDYHTELWGLLDKPHEFVEFGPMLERVVLEIAF